METNILIIESISVTQRRNTAALLQGVVNLDEIIYITEKWYIKFNINSN
jgi:hypothetical protein